MTTDISLSVRTIEAQINTTQINTRQDQGALVYGRDNPTLLNRQQQDIVDQVGISDAAIRQFEDAQRLADQLQAYNNYLFGDESNVRLTEPRPREGSVIIAGRSSELAATITTASIREETLQLDASFDNTGNLESLSFTRTETNIDYISAEIITRDTQFLGAINA